MNYKTSISDFFKSPQWGMNLLFGALTFLIPIVGPVVLSGWHVTILWARGNDEDPTRFPSFDFQYFGKYLERGLWPFLVSLVASLVLMPILMVCMIGPMFFAGIMDHAAHRYEEAFPIAMMICMFVSYLVVIIGFNLLIIPLMLRATITQGFGEAFDLGFMRKFLSLVWVDLLMAALFMLLLAFCMMIITVVTCYIGGLAAAPVFFFTWHHLQKQLYQLYLARGGEPVPLSPKLNDGPPPLPGF